MGTGLEEHSPAPPAAPGNTPEVPCLPAHKTHLDFGLLGNADGLLSSVVVKRHIQYWGRGGRKVFLFFVVVGFNYLSWVRAY